MIKRTLCFTNPAYLSLRDKQMVIRLPEVENSGAPDALKKEATRTVPVEDIGVVVLDNKQITMTHGLLEALLENNCAVITCDSRSLPVGLMLPLCGNTVQNERFREQISASLPLKKQLWQQTVKTKIANQAAVLAKHTGAGTGCMARWAADVRSGDPDNLEGRAAAYYWRNLFAAEPGLDGFTRDRQGPPPNNLLNYGYAILRAVVARSLVSSGMLPTLGIHRLRRQIARRPDKRNENEPARHTRRRRHNRRQTQPADGGSHADHSLAVQMLHGRSPTDSLSRNVKATEAISYNKLAFVS